MKTYLLLILSIIMTSCSQTPTIPKPNAYLKLSYPNTGYKTTQQATSYQFEHSNQSNFRVNKQQWANIYYPKLKAEINITYHPINKNLTQLISDAEKLTYKHTLKADNIEVYPFENYDKKVYARLFTLSGDVASPLQFQITDSIKNFLYGSLYFNARPNYDSILPAIDYINKDIKHIIETLEWTNQ